MPPPFRKVTMQQFESLLEGFPYQRRIDSVHMHHTWRPNHAQFAGHQTIVGMWRVHTSENGWSDIAQHLTVDPQGDLWLGRDWNLPPASAVGHNGSAAAGPFMFEMIGDFDHGRDPFGGPQKAAAHRITALLLDRFALPTRSLRFQDQMSQKSCPGDGISYESTIRDVEALRRHVVDAVPAPANERDESATPHPAPGRNDASSIGAAGADDEVVRELALGLMLGGLRLPPADGVPGEAAEKEGSDQAASDADARSGGGRDGPFRSRAVTINMIEGLLPHVVNLSRGRFSAGGRFRTTSDDVDAIFDDHLETAVAQRYAGGPLRIVVWAHGGLVGEADGLHIAHKHVGWWKRNGVYPIYFAWETGLLEALGRVIAGRSGLVTDSHSDGLTDISDRAIEGVARLVGGPEIWADMKQNAELAADKDEGGAAYVARRLAAFCERHDGKVEVHAVGHSAGANFQASFLPALFEAGMPSLKSLALLAPAVSVDLFRERLAPLIGPGRPVERIALFTMSRLRELDDHCIGIYRKSLLYLIHHALEDRRETPILGLETSLRSDGALKGLFGLDRTVAAPGEVVWSRSSPDAAPRRRSTSVTHGGFDDDGPTMDSVLRRILGRDAISSYAASEADLAETRRERVQVTDAQPARRHLGLPLEPAGDVSDEPYGVPFAVLDAFERCTEIAAAADVDGFDPPEADATDALSIEFGPNARSGDVTSFSLSVLRDIMGRAGVGRVQISSTSRSPADQARVMYANLVSYGVEHQKRLYGPAGDQVIEVYRRAKNDGRSPATTKALMTEEIIRVGPTRVSRHAADPKVLNVFDVAPSSVSRRSAFEDAVRSDPRVARFIKPPADPGYHLEIPQPTT